MKKLGTRCRIVPAWLSTEQNTFTRCRARTCHWAQMCNDWVRCACDRSWTSYWARWLQHILRGARISSPVYSEDIIPLTNQNSTPSANKQHQGFRKRAVEVAWRLKCSFTLMLSFDFWTLCPQVFRALSARISSQIQGFRQGKTSKHARIRASVQLGIKYSSKWSHWSRFVLYEFTDAPCAACACFACLLS